jgi:hypothetical protein
VDPLEGWYTSLRASGRCRDGSSTWGAYRRWLLDFCNHAGLEPAGLVAEAASGVQGLSRVKSLLASYILELERRGLSQNTRAQAAASVKSFLSHHGIRLVYNVPAQEPMARRLPEPGEIARVVQSLLVPETPARAEAAAFILVAKDSGLSASTILSLTWDGGQPHHEPIGSQLARGRIPVHIRVRRSKTGVVHDSFIGREGVWGLRRLLRACGVERPEDASGRVFRHGRQAVYMLVRRAAESAGVALTPKMLRKFFITRMKMARVRDLHPAAWDSMVEHMAEHAISRVQRAYFILSPEELERHYVENYGAIEVGLPSEEYAAVQATENSQT